MGTDIGNIIGLQLQNQYGKKAPRAPLFAQTPEPGYERALREYTSRLLAQGATSVPPSLHQWLASGGTAKLDLGNTAFTPGEMVGLGMVGKQGQPVPWTSPGQQQLTPAQIMFIAAQGKGSIGDTKQIQQSVNEFKRLQKLEGLKQTPKREKRESRIAGKLSKSGSPLSSGNGG